VCRAVRNDVISVGDGLTGFGASENKDCNGVALDEPRARDKVWRKDANLFDWGVVGIGGGDEGRLDGFDGRGAFFLLPNDLNNDHSDSN
jgi:hypothetical protein